MGQLFSHRVIVRVKGRTKHPGLPWRKERIKMVKRKNKPKQNRRRGLPTASSKSNSVTSE